MGTFSNKTQKICCDRCGVRSDVVVSDPSAVMECPNCHAPLGVPMRLNQFQLIRMIGNGSMGKVYQAMDLTLKRPVAVKIVHTLSSKGQANDKVALCLREARAMAALNHPNVVQIHTVEEKDGLPYIVMELVDGGRLSQMIESDGPLDEAEVLRIGIGVAEGLNAALCVGLIHGDVKPANILVDQQSVAKLIDFGVARFTRGTRSSKSFGTPQYVAPEIVLKKKEDHRADIFSLGVTLYHALTGVYPFKGRTVDQVLRARLKQRAPGIRLVRDTLCVETADVISQMLETDPSRRCRTYDELIEGLKKALNTVMSGSEGPDLHELNDALETTRPIRRRKKRRARSARKPVIVLLLVVIVLILWISAVVWWGSHREVPGQVPKAVKKEAVSD